MCSARRAMRAQWAVAALLQLASALPIVAQVPNGYFLGDPVLLPDSLSERYDGGAFSLVVIRLWRDSAENILIQTAERLLPLADSIAAAVERYPAEHSRSGRWPSHFAEAAAAPGPRWWWHRWDRVWLPYALTGAAVDHYLTEMRGLVRNTYGEPGFRPTGRFEYSAAVELAGAVRMVRLSMKWSYHCGRLCGLWFSHERRVHFDANGEITRVEGDGPPRWMVS